ncbi:hypothetical protein GH714_031074 [Hevea brasiliensis]|uniref:Uncharacterized protein n=1 Tax=Hevea brasiliensis TaxID=3981 RepID=A0A6A6LF98_HEVBR|nr:hypothetical protein GH714_031074 [Hevea brasiliensis]
MVNGRHDFWGGEFEGTSGGHARHTSLLPLRFPALPCGAAYDPWIQLVISASNGISWLGLQMATRLDKTRFYIVGAGIFTGITLALYPMSVVKTRLQVAAKDTVERNAFSVVRGILKTDGIAGLYRGFSTGAIPVRIIFHTALETAKVAAFKMVEPFKLSEPVQAAVANGIAGMMASLLSQAVFVPIDVQYIDSFGKPLGHGTELKGTAPSQLAIMLVQVMGQERKSSTRQVAKNLIKDDGWGGLHRGFGPRFFSMSAWGTSRILAYEYLSKDIFLSFPIILLYYYLVTSGGLQISIMVFNLLNEVVHT